MVIEHFRNQDPKPIGERFKRMGRMMPEGVVYHASWIDPAAVRCFQVMEADSMEHAAAMGGQLGRPRRFRDRAGAHLAGVLGHTAAHGPHEKTGPAEPDRSSLELNPVSLDDRRAALSPVRAVRHAEPRWCQSASGQRMRVDGSPLTDLIVTNQPRGINRRSMGLRTILGAAWPERHSGLRRQRGSAFARGSWRCASHRGPSA